MLGIRKHTPKSTRDLEAYDDQTALERLRGADDGLDGITEPDLGRARTL